MHIVIQPLQFRISDLRFEIFQFQNSSALMRAHRRNCSLSPISPIFPNQSSWFVLVNATTMRKPTWSLCSPGLRLARLEARMSLSLSAQLPPFTERLAPLVGPAGLRIGEVA